MTKKPSAEERIIAGLEGFADALERGENVPEKLTCRKVVLNLEPTSYNSDLVRETRGVLGLSQALFAQFLGVSSTTVCNWEQGVCKPEQMACRFMDEIRSNPKYWRQRFLELVEPKKPDTCPA